MAGLGSGCLDICDHFRLFARPSGEAVIDRLQPGRCRPCCPRFFHAIAVAKAHLHFCCNRGRGLPAPPGAYRVSRRR